MRQLKRTWVEIDLDALAHNFFTIRNIVGAGVDIMAIVKADGYGHGAKQVAYILDKCGADWFGVSNINEAKYLRKVGITKPILILGYTPAENVKELFELDITQTVFSLEYARNLANAAAEANVRIDVHIKVDTGMSRLGFSANDIGRAVNEISEVCTYGVFRVTGMFTHFAVADEGDSKARAYTLEQHNRFAAISDELENRGFTFFHKHCCNSGGLLFYPQFYHEMVRPGLILYGNSPTGAPLPNVPFKPVMTLKSVVSMVKEIKAGDCVSYGCTYTAPHDMKVATVSIGYADGYPRSLSNKGLGWVAGRIAPIVGRVCMDQLMLDVTGADVHEGDIVTFFGGGSPISLDNVAGLAGTVSYELMCSISRRVQRIFISNGKVFDVVDYTF